MKCMLQRSAALAIALLMSSGAVANSEDSFSNAVKLTGGQLETIVGGSVLELDLLALSDGESLVGIAIPIAINLGDAIGQNTSGLLPVSVQVPINLGDAIGQSDNESASANPILINLGGSIGQALGLD